MLGVLIVTRAQLINYNYVSFVSTFSSQSYVGGRDRSSNANILLV